MYSMRSSYVEKTEPEAVTVDTRLVGHNWVWLRLARARARNFMLKLGSAKGDIHSRELHLQGMYNIQKVHREYVFETK